MWWRIVAAAPPLADTRTYAPACPQPQRIFCVLLTCAPICHGSTYFLSPSPVIGDTLTVDTNAREARNSHTD